MYKKKYKLDLVHFHILNQLNVKLCFFDFGDVEASQVSVYECGLR
jgi:hypothetical protein